MKDFSFKEILIGSKINKINRACDLIMFSFEMLNGKKLFLHITCFIRIFDSDNTLVICTQNLNNRSPNNKKKKYDWTEAGATVFDDAIKDYQDKLMSTKVLNASFDYDDIKIIFENGMRMDVLVTTTKYDDPNYDEDYRIFDEDKSKKHYVIPQIK